jgi:hypothetical protein
MRGRHRNSSDRLSEAIRVLLLSFISRILIVNEHGRRANFGLGEALEAFRVVMKMFRDGTWKTSLSLF